ncbi:MAG: GTP-binding protein [Lachnospiraceae bacterium]|nr:GTP-binding protein [Lachnoclostridium sp.]MDY2598952.1 GTP-binding protein [Lachnospiraceae bacterium]
MTKIDIISGFLGAGKTTLIKKLIDGAFTGEKLVLIENEFGEIGIDGGFLKDAGVQITEMNQGCICCSLVGDFGKALKEVIDTYSPDRIIIEPSGVGKLSDVIKAVLDLGHIDGVVLNSSTTVVDCTKAKMYMKNFGEFFNNQIESAGAVILSRTQIAKEGQVEDCVARIREKNADAAIVTTPWDDIDAAAIVGAMEHTSSVNEMIAQAIKEHEHHHDHDHEEHEHHHDHDHEEHEHHHDHDHHHEHGEDCTCGCHDHDHEHGHHHADDVFTSWGKETAKTFEKDKLDTILDTLANTEKYGVILRAKGIVQSASGKWFNFDLTPGEYEIREGVADYTGKLCVIGTKLDEDGLVELFEL